MIRFTLRKLFGLDGTSTRHQKAKPRFPLRLEGLEDRAVPAVLWVDSTPGMAGTQFTASGGSQPASVTGLTPGVNIFPTIQAAVSAAGAGDTINVDRKSTRLNSSHL